MKKASTLICISRKLSTSRPTRFLRSYVLGAVFSLDIPPNYGCFVPEQLESRRREGSLFRRDGHGIRERLQVFNVALQGSSSIDIPGWFSFGSFSEVGERLYRARLYGEWGSGGLRNEISLTN